MVYEPDFNNIKEYKKVLLGNTIKSLNFIDIGDEQISLKGLVIEFTNGAILEFDLDFLDVKDL